MLECVVSTYITVYIHIILKYKFLGVIIAFFFYLLIWALAGIAWCIEFQSVNQRVAGSISSQGT